MATNTTAIIAKWAQDTNNKSTFTQEQIKNGIIFQADILSNQLNGVFFNTTSSVRFLQVTAGLWDQLQVYNQNEMSEVLLAKDGLIKRRKYMCKNNTITNRPPISGSGGGSSPSNIDIINYTGSNTEDTANWKRVVEDNSIEATTSLSSNYMYLLCNSSTTPSGTLKIKIYKGSSLNCSFHLHFSGFDYKTFDIPRCEYSEVIKKTRVNSSYGNIFYPGFGIMVTPSGIYLAVNSTTQADKMVVDYFDANFIPPLSSTTFVSPSSNENLPYAIRKGGGSEIKNLGCVFNNLRNNSNNQKGHTYDYYLFSNGFVAWTSAVSLNSAYYHQYANGGFASLNIDVSDAVFRNVGSKAGTTIGARQTPQLPNIRGQVFSSGRDGTPGGGYKSIRNYLSGTGCFSPAGSQGTTPVSTDDTVNFDASRSNSIYSNSGDVRGVTLVCRTVVQAF